MLRSIKRAPARCSFATRSNESVASGAFPNAEVTVTGAPYFLKDINDYLKGGMLQLGAIAVVVMMIILLLLFHVRWRLLPLGVILVGVIWAFGMAGYIGIPLTLVTIAGLPVMLGIGIDYAIQMHARVEEEVVIDRDPHPIQATARGLGPALLVVTFDAVFAFAALRFAKVPMLRDFGWLLTVGIIVICFTSIVLPLSILGIREYKSPTKGRDFRQGVLGRLTVKLGSLPMWVAPILAIGSFAVFFGGIAVEDKLELQSDPIQWVNQSSKSIKDYRYVEQQTGSSSELAFFIQTAPDEIFSQESVNFVSDFSRELLDKYGHDIPPGKISPELLTATSLVTTVDYAIAVPGASVVNPRSSDVEAAYDLAPPDIQRSTVNPPAGAQNLIFRYGDRTLDERKDTVNAIRDSVQPPEGIRAVPSGLAIVGVGLLENLQANRILLTYLAILFVGLFLTIRLKSIVRALLSLVPVTIAVGAASLIAYVLGFKLSPMTAVGGPLIVAACTEFTSLILLRYLEERRRGLWPRQAVDVAAGRTGRAFIVSGLTAISGILVIATSSLPLLRDFGLVVGMNVTVALASALDRAAADAGVGGQSGLGLEGRGARRHPASDHAPLRRPPRAGRGTRKRSCRLSRRSSTSAPPVGSAAMADESAAAVGPNSWLVDEMYDQYVADPSSVSESWREFFHDYRPATGSVPQSLDTAASAPSAAPSAPAATPATPAPAASTSVEGEPLRGAAARIVANMEASLAGAHCDQLPRGPRQAARGQSADHQRLPRPQAGRQGLVHPRDRFRGGAGHHRDHAGDELDLRRGARREASGHPARTRRPGSRRRRRERRRIAHSARARHPRCGHPRLPRRSGSRTRTSSARCATTSSARTTSPASPSRSPIRARSAPCNRCLG